MAHQITQAPAKPSQKMYIWGALLALVLIAALMMWAAELITRDIDGVPVIKAASNPLRIEPKERNAPEPKYSELTINDVISPDHSASGADQEVRVLEEQVNVQEEDLVPLDISLETQKQLDILTQSGTQDMTEFETGLEFDENRQGSEIVPAPLGGLPEVPLSQEVSDGVAAALEEVLAVDAARNRGALEGQITVSLRAPHKTSAPRLRPSSTGASEFIATEPSQSIELSMRREIPPSEVPFDDYVVQLIAMQTPEEARARWDEIVARNPAYFENKFRVISQTKRNGTTLYRLRVAGFSGSTDASAFCAALEQTGQECLVTQMR